MTRNPNITERLRSLIVTLQQLSKSGELHWERQLGSAHRYARWKNNLIILGPAEAPGESNVPRYLFVTPFDSPACVEVNSDDEELGSSVLELVQIVERKSKNTPATDPFGLSEEVLKRLV
ncbi:MAG: hypothetical protein C5B55_03850 [Blastocatellia bacterium]|nr:MAG: hypothetical protein C5B55_03850 [Blastocatellia bacterium]